MNNLGVLLSFGSAALALYTVFRVCRGPLIRTIIVICLVGIISLTFGPAMIADLTRSGLLYTVGVALTLVALAGLAVPALAARGRSIEAKYLAYGGMAMVAAIAVFSLVARFRFDGAAAAPMLGGLVASALFVSYGLHAAQRRFSGVSQVAFSPASGVNQAAYEAPQVQMKAEASSSSKPLQLQRTSKNMASIAGMAPLKAELATIIRLYSDLDKKKTLPDRNGLLLSGPPGNGKTLVAECIAGELKLPLLKVSVTDVAHKHIGAPLEKLTAIIQQAKASAPCVLFFDEFEALGGSRDDANKHEESAKMVDALLTSIDDLRRYKVVLIAATNFPDKLDSALIRDGRFDFKIEIPYPDYEARLQIISGLMRKYSVALEIGVMEQISRHWVERSASFIEGTFKRVRDETKPGDRQTLSSLKDIGRKQCRRETAIPKDCDDLSALSLPAVVRKQVEGLIYRMSNWEHVVAQGGSAPKGILLYGPPGTGKTTLVRAMAKSLSVWHVFEVKTAEVLADPRKFSDVIRQAKQHRPAIVFLDEADELLRDRNMSSNITATNEILKAMDGMMAAVPEVVFIAATNKMEVIDEAALRGGRFSDRIYVPRSQGADLVDLVAAAIKARPLMRLAQDATPKTIAEMLGEAAPADVKDILSQAVNSTLQSGSGRPVTLRDIQDALEAAAM